MLLGLDIGTTSCKAVIFDRTGQIIALRQAPTVMENEGDGLYSIDPKGLWETVCDLIRGLFVNIAPERITALSVTSMAESGLLVDSLGNSLSPIIPYFDERSREQTLEVESTIGAQRIFEITGLNLHSIFSLTKIMWLRDNQPEIFAKAKRWLCIPDYLNFRLTGQMATDFSIACRTMAFDIHGLRWSREILREVGLQEDLFPSVQSSGQLIGWITDNAAHQTGLTMGTPVVLGGHDHFCGSLAAGLLLGGRVIDSSGTSESVHALLPQGNQVDARYRGFSVGRYVDGESIYVGGGFNSSGISVEWITRQSCSWEESLLPKIPEKLYQQVMEQAKKIAPGSQGLLFLPHLRGSGYPTWDFRSSGAFVGLRAHHHRFHKVRSVIEAVCFEVKAVVDKLQEMVIHDLNRVVVIGGGAKNELWLQIKADVLGIPVEVPDLEEATALGAAMLAGTAVGSYRDLLDASKSMAILRKTFYPNDEHHKLYTQFYSINRSLYAATKSIHNKIETILSSQ